MNQPLSLFEGYGIEIEAMVVDAESLNVLPIVDELMRRASGTEEWVEEIDDGPIGWSNEFVAHVIELKTNGPAASLDPLEAGFRASTLRINQLLKEWNAVLLPTAMHPWMDPRTETTFWAHDTGPVYRAYHRIFDARRHGWANLQSVHLNLPFGNEREFARLMAAVRLVLPLIPALAASSPIVEGVATGLMDSRLDFYRNNSERVAAMTGQVIPEPIFDSETYRTQVFGQIDQELIARGADPVLIGQEWTNARGAIARFDRNAIEIRLIDSQECAAADLAIAGAVSALVQALVEERWSSFEQQKSMASAELVALLGQSIKHAASAKFKAPELGSLLGFKKPPATLGALLQELMPSVFHGPPELEQALCVVLEHGTLSQRILGALGPDFERNELRELYRELAGCMSTGKSFQA